MIVLKILGFVILYLVGFMVTYRIATWDAKKNKDSIFDLDDSDLIFVSLVWPIALVIFLFGWLICFLANISEYK